MSALSTSAVLFVADETFNRLWIHKLPRLQVRSDPTGPLDDPAEGCFTAAPIPFVFHVFWNFLCVRRLDITKASSAVQKTQVQKFFFTTDSRVESGPRSTSQIREHLPVQGPECGCRRWNHRLQMVSFCCFFFFSTWTELHPTRGGTHLWPRAPLGRPHADLGLSSARPRSREHQMSPRDINWCARLKMLMFDWMSASFLEPLCVIVALNWTGHLMLVL